MDTDSRPILVWFRRDLRLADHPALSAACESGRPVIAVFILDPETEALGAAAKWRLEQGVEVFARRLAERGSRLILRRGAAMDVLRDLIAQTGAGAVYWSRLYDPASRERDSRIKAALKDRGLAARSFGGHLLREPFDVMTKAGSYFKVFTPYWRAVSAMEVPVPLSEPAHIPAPATWPASDDLHGWAMGAAMRRGGAVVAAHVQAGEDAARDRLDAFVEDGLAQYPDRRDLPGHAGTSGLSDHLSLGEISPLLCWTAAGRAGTGAAFQRQLIWREFAYHLMFHTPHMLRGNWKPDWDGFPWSEDRTHPGFLAWQQGRTGVRFVDAAMREMYVTGRMHNRGRMVAASYLTKHLMVHWRLGMQWFEDCLVDWDPACNAMGWQWVAGSGPDAAPYFRVFNPDTQLARFDPGGAYVARWIAEGARQPSETALSYFDAVPHAWNLRPDAPYPAPVVALDEGRKAALAAYQARKGSN